jgi:hypothetical protein
MKNRPLRGVAEVAERHAVDRHRHRDRIADALVGRPDGVDDAVVIEPVLAGGELGIDDVDVDRRGRERRAGGVPGGGGDRRGAELDEVAVERAAGVGGAQRGVADRQLDRRDLAGDRQLRGERRGDPPGARLEHVAGERRAGRRLGERQRHRRGRRVVAPAAAPANPDQGHQQERAGRAHRVAFEASTPSSSSPKVGPSDDMGKAPESHRLSTAIEIAATTRHADRNREVASKLPQRHNGASTSHLV